MDAGQRPARRPPARSSASSDLLADRHHAGERCRTSSSPGRPQRVGDAIAVLQEYGISQLPVSEQPDGDAIEGIVGSITEKGLLDRAFRDPAIVERTVGEVMDRPLPLVDVDTSLDAAFALLRGRVGADRDRAASGRPASSPSSTCSSTSPTGDRRVADQRVA